MASSRKRVEIKVEDLCRTCLAKEIELCSIFDVYLEVTTLDHIITSVTGVEIDRSDGLPSKICLECKDKAVNAYDFKKKSQEAAVALHSIFKKENGFIILEETLSIDNNNVDVKLERYGSDYHEDSIDLQYNTELPADDNSFSDTDVVKNEGNENETESDKICNRDIVAPDNTQEKSQKKCIKVEVEESSSTFCPLCCISFIDSDGLTKHMWERHAEFMGPKKRGRPKKMVTGTILNKLSENGYYLKTVRVKRLNCSFCKEKFKTKEELVTHMTEHKDLKVFCCIICKKMYLKKKYFDSHSCADVKTEGNNLQENNPPMVIQHKDEQGDFLMETYLHQLWDLSKNPVIEPYKRVLSHAGYDSSGADTARPDYRYVMDNLFLYVIWTLERLVTDEYVLIYLHGSAGRRCLPTFAWLHKCYKLIDKRLRRSLKHLYLVHPTF